MVWSIVESELTIAEAVARACRAETQGANALHLMITANGAADSHRVWIRSGRGDPIPT